MSRLSHYLELPLRGCMQATSSLDVEAQLISAINERASSNPAPDYPACFLGRVLYGTNALLLRL